MDRSGRTALSRRAIPSARRQHAWHSRCADRNAAPAPERLRAAVSGLNDAQLDTPYRDGGWTVRQVVHHFADSHANSYIRFKLALTEDWPTIKPYDEAAWARLPDSRMPIDRSLVFIARCTRAWSRCSNPCRKRISIAASTIPSGTHDSRHQPRPLRVALAPPRRPHHQPARSAWAGKRTPCTPVQPRPSSRNAQTPAPKPHRPRSWRKIIEAYLADHPAAALLEDGRVLFDMRTARYSVTESHGRCLLQLWSEERNLVRTVVDVQQRAQCLRLITRRMGAAKPQIARARSHQRPPHPHRPRCRPPQLSAPPRARAHPPLHRRKVDGLRTAMDLEHSFGPAYVRGRLLKGTAADAVIGVSAAESASVIDGVLTLGILWLDYCRQHADARRHFGGLKVIVPAGRLAHHRRAHGLAQSRRRRIFALFTLDERSEELAPVDFRDTGNLDSRLVHAFSPAAALERCRAGIDRLLALVPAAARERVEIRAHSPTEVGLLLHGLEFARVRHGVSAHSFAREDEVTFGAGAERNPAHPGK